ncbi:MAG: AAA family ATPase [Deltaproteobacteria bacterium]|nr:AAA family ATPase [Deltaproteobacteria bacterium]
MALGNLGRSPDQPQKGFLAKNMITKVELNNYRCFNNFSIDKITPITLISGLNNVGKSALLESIFLFYARNSSDVFFKLNKFRQIPPLFHPSQFNGSWLPPKSSPKWLTPNWLWGHFFSNMNLDNDIKIIIYENNNKQSLILSKVHLSSIYFVLDILPPDIFDLKNPNLITDLMENTLLINFKNQKNSDKFYYLLYDNDIHRFPASKKNIVDTFIQYLSNNIYVQQGKLAEYFTILDFNGNKYKLINILKSIEPSIKDVAAIMMRGFNSIFIDIGLPTKLPLNYFGYGINKLTQIALTMLSNPRALLLIDAIDEGFHFEFLPKLWEIIGDLAWETNSQVLATTHNLECLKSSKVLISDKFPSKLFSYIRLDNIKNTIKPILFSNEEFKYAIENNIELR